MPAVLLLGLLAASVLMSPGPVDATTLHHYSVGIDSALERLLVRACFDGRAPAHLKASAPGARDYLLRPRVQRGDDPEPLSVGEGGIRTGGMTTDGCVTYAVDAARAVAEGADRNSAHTPDYLLLRAGNWLWLPAPRADEGDVEVAFTLPAGLAVSAPWRRTESGAFRLGRAPRYWPALVAIGRFSVQPVAVPGSVLQLAVLPGDPAPDSRAMARWIGEAALAVTTLYGHFPFDGPQILVVPIGQRSEPVPWGQVLRGGQPAAHFFVDQTRPLAEFRADWTAAHELSHMLMPYLGSDNAWLAEGFASYYQNVLRARAGLLEERDAWQNLHDGFQRGRLGTRGLPLNQASRNMRRDGAYMRVYWSGAAFALKADLALRTATGGTQSLDTALAGLAACCLPANRRWSATRLVERLDGLTGTQVVSRLYAQHVDDRRFPDLTLAYRALGLMLEDDRIVLDDTAPGAALRAAIMGDQKAAASALDHGSR